jgi:cellulose synthase/poly-beta-1,6-N-acetylglucosamine synthase-like glycosyltransferase
MIDEANIKHTVSILIPSRGYCHMAFAMCLRNLEMPPMTLLETKYNTGCFVDIMRNELAGAARMDWVLFIDDDVLPKKDALIKLIALDKDIVSGVYFARQQPHWPQVFKVNKENGERYDPIWEWKKDGPYEIDAAGAGFLLVKREVFNKVSLPWFKCEQDETGRRSRGEDMYFCRKAKEAGFKIWVDPSVVLSHISDSFIGPEFWQVSLDQINEMKKNMTDKEWKEFLIKTQN